MVGIIPRLDAVGVFGYSIRNFIRGVQMTPRTLSRLYALALTIILALASSNIIENWIL